MVDTSNSKPGDVINGYVLLAEGNWVPVQSKARAPKSYKWLKASLITATAVAALAAGVGVATSSASTTSGTAKATSSASSSTSSASSSTSSASSSTFTDVVEDITPSVYYGYGIGGVNPLHADGSNPTTRELAETTLKAFAGNRSVTSNKIAIAFQRTGNIYQSLDNWGMPHDQIERLRVACIAISQEREHH